MHPESPSFSSLISLEGEVTLGVDGGGGVGANWGYPSDLDGGGLKLESVRHKMEI